MAVKDYQKRQEAKRKRYQNLAEKKKQQSDQLHQEAKSMASVIPFGQPILVGHHSEGRDRRYRDRVHNKFGKAFEASGKAEYYDEKAKAIGTGGISSDDPDAIPKLKAKLKALQESHELMKEANKLIRAGGDVSSLVKLGLPEPHANEILTPDSLGRTGFAPYILQSSNSEMRRVKSRIKQLERAASAVRVEKKYGNVTYVENPDENRVQLIFPGKPDDETRKVLKQRGFRWSRRNGAWQRHLNNAGKYSAKWVLKTICDNSEVE